MAQNYIFRNIFLSQYLEQKYIVCMGPWAHQNAVKTYKIKSCRFGQSYECDVAAGKNPLCSKFYQHFMSSFLCQYSVAKKLHSQNVSGKKLQKTLLYKKAARKMLGKSTPGFQPSWTVTCAALMSWTTGKQPLFVQSGLSPTIFSPIMTLLKLKWYFVHVLFPD
jgi:hypothetical protein